MLFSAVLQIDLLCRNNVSCLSKIEYLPSTNDPPSSLSAEDSYGTAGKVNRPGPTEVSGQGLEDFYSVNESVYEYRQNDRLSLVDWTNYLEDVDRVFALLNGHRGQNKTRQTETARSDGLLAASAQPSVPVDRASPGSDEDPRPVVGGAPHLTLPADLQTLHLNRPTFSPESKLEWNNDIPEVSSLNSEHWRNQKTDKQLEREEMSHLDLDLSGSDGPGPELQPSPQLQPTGRRRKGLPRAGGPDVSGGRLSPPARSRAAPTPPATRVSAVGQPVRPGTESVWNEVERSHGRGTG